MHLSGRAVALIALLLASAPLSASNPDIQALLERIEKLESETRELKLALVNVLDQVDTSAETRSVVDQEVMGSLSEDLALLQENSEQETRVGGYVDIEYRDSDAPGVNPSTRLHHLSLFYTKQFDHRLRFFSEIEFEDAPVFSSSSDEADFKSKNGKIFLEAVNLTYAWKPELGFRAGRFFTPAGIWSEDHYPPFVVTQERPLIIRKIFPQLVDGLSAQGIFPQGKGFVSYDFYVGNGQGNTGNRDDNSSTARGLRLRYESPGFLDSTFGFDAYQDRLNSGNQQTVLGLHAKIRYGIFSAQSEWAKSNVRIPGASDNRKDGFYLQMQGSRADWTWGVRHGEFNTEENLVSSHTRRNSLFVNFHYSPETVLKFEYHDTNADGIETGSYVFSIASFLGL